MSQSGASPRAIDWLLFVLAPLFFSTNLIFGRGITGDIGPFITAFLRWFGATLLILPLIWHDRRACLDLVRRHTLLWLVLGILGMGICGGFVYWALTKTTASNATLIYTTSSLFILLFQCLFQGRRLRLAEICGMAIAFAGVATIVLKGEPAQLLAITFNIGDLGVLLAAVAFALYSMLLRKPSIAAMRPLSLFGLLAASGAIVLFPPALVEFLSGAPVPDSASDWLKLAGIIAFASLAAFYCFQHSVRVFGPAQAGVTLYLMPPISILLAILFLGEAFQSYHAAGIVLVMGGVFLATAPRPRLSAS
ncbi:DMT family transporter [Rhizobium sp. SSA_523]|uniref:DMT family transporter n=1 Tax=Rhizobium sp. SSA_523 TaxID=2952477 RepID=UPI00209056E4|nr:DMT family transporter [Rhizobium sp. SSA_523]MCO5733750.1 DMT family transporter [Rhizobium sp. SSA_523]WKC24976.1 DMT family transporter [Rhizobium sp. SSA_523]